MTKWDDDDSDFWYLFWGLILTVVGAVITVAFWFGLVYFLFWTARQFGVI